MKYLILLTGLILSASAMASEPVELGELQLKGNIRRPSVAFYQLKSLRDEQLQELSELSFKEFEEKLTTQPSQAEAKDEKSN